MILLLDTHALIWALEDSPRLSPTARAAIVERDNQVLVSVASAWEMAIKQALGRLEMPDDLEEVIDASGFAKRLITFADTRRAVALPPHHEDPFDRMLVAQAMVDGVPIVTCDPLIARYQVQVLW